MTHKQANAGQRARSIAMKRKEEYLGARVPKDLREKVVRRAEELGIPVSILIRDILIAAFNNAGIAAEEPSTIVRSGSAPGKEASQITQAGTKFSSVLGWEEIRLNKAIECSNCGVGLIPGSIVTLGLGGPEGGHVVLCNKCKEAV
jgi:hypothetical protein